jgi:hypothetical protein
MPHVERARKRPWPNLPSLLAQRPLEASTLATGRKNLAVSELAQAARERAVKLALVQLAAPVAPVFERAAADRARRWLTKSQPSTSVGGRGDRYFSITVTTPTQDGLGLNHCVAPGRPLPRHKYPEQSIDGGETAAAASRRHKAGSRTTPLSFVYKLPVMYARMRAHSMSLPLVPPLSVSPYHLKEGNGDRSEGCLGARQVPIRAAET